MVLAFAVRNSPAFGDEMLISCENETTQKILRRLRNFAGVKWLRDNLHCNSYVNRCRKLL